MPSGLDCGIKDARGVGTNWRTGKETQNQAQQRRPKTVNCHLWKPKVHSGRKFQTIWPGAGGGRAEDGTNLVDLIGFGRAGEQGSQREQFRHDAPACKQIDG